MIVDVFFAFLAGVLTIAAPCVLPLLPIILGASIGQRNLIRPLFITFGFIVSFAGLSLIFGASTHFLGLSQNALHDAAICLLALFGILMIWSTPIEWLTERLNGVINKVNAIGDRAAPNNLGAFIIGLTLGVVWTPCAGPVLGSILTLIATEQAPQRATILLIVYAIGAGIPMLAIAYGGQFVTTRVRKFTRYAHRLQQIFGVFVLLLAVAMYFQYDIAIEAWLASLYPQARL